MTPETTGREQDGKFAPGQSGNPAGRPRGARHKTTLAVQAMLEGEAEALTRKAVELALAGDITALRLCLERIAPARKDYPVSISLPDITSAADASRVMAALLAAVGNGDVTPSEGSEVAKLVETYINTLEATEYEARLRALEERAK